jgi:hypothetical protein
MRNVGYAFQHLLRRALWDPEAVRHELRYYIVQHLGTRRRRWSSTKPAV